MPDNRSVCAKCGQIYGEGYAPVCDCVLDNGLLEPVGYKAWCKLCGKEVIEKDEDFYPTCDCAYNQLLPKKQESCEEEMKCYLKNTGFSITELKYALLILAKHIDDIKQNTESKPIHQSL